MDRQVATTDPAPSRVGGGLTAREIEVLRHLAKGRSMREIAGRLTLSPETVDAHVQHIHAKVGVSTCAGATLFAMQHGLVDSLDGYHSREDRGNSR